MSRAGSKEHTARTKREDKVREFMNSEDWAPTRLPEMREYLEALDKHRGNSFYETFPEMAGIFRDIS